MARKSHSRLNGASESVDRGLAAQGRRRNGEQSVDMMIAKRIAVSVDSTSVGSERRPIGPSALKATTRWEVAHPNEVGRKENIG